MVSKQLRDLIQKFRKSEQDLQRWMAMDNSPFKLEWLKIYEASFARQLEAIKAQVAREKQAEEEMAKWYARVKRTEKKVKTKWVVSNSSKITLKEYRRVFPAKLVKQLEKELKSKK